MRRIAALTFWVLVFSLNITIAQIQADSGAVLIDSIVSQSLQIQNDSSQNSNKNDTIAAFNDGHTNHIASIRFLFPKDSLDIYRYSFNRDDSINYVNLRLPDT
jgi:hypothetical protein